MICCYDLNTIYEYLNQLKIDLFCTNSCKKREQDIVEEIVCKLIDNKFYKENSCECEKDISLLEVLIYEITYIQKCGKCEENYGYLAQLERFKCILKNIKKLICQLGCLCLKKCELTAQLLCVLYEILELLQNIISKIVNIECICESCLCCKEEILECMLCNLVNVIGDLEERTQELAHIVLELTMKNIINCTPCTIASSTCKRDYVKDYYNLCSYNECCISKNKNTNK